MEITASMVETQDLAPMFGREGGFKARKGKKDWAKGESWQRWQNAKHTKQARTSKIQKTRLQPAARSILFGHIRAFYLVFFGVVYLASYLTYVVWFYLTVNLTFYLALSLAFSVTYIHANRRHANTTLFSEAWKHNTFFSALCLLHKNSLANSGLSPFDKPPIHVNPKIILSFSFFFYNARLNIRIYAR